MAFGHNFDLLRHAERLFSHGERLGLATAALFRREPRAIRLSKLVRQHSPPVVRNRLVWCAISESVGHQSVSLDSRSTAGWCRDTGLLDRSNVGPASITTPVRLLRIGKRGIIRPVALGGIRQGRHHPLHVPATSVLFGACLDC